MTFHAISGSLGDSLEYHCSGNAQERTARVEVYNAATRKIVGEHTERSYVDSTSRDLYNAIFKVYRFYSTEMHYEGCDGRGTIPPLVIKSDRGTWICYQSNIAEKCGFRFRYGIEELAAAVAHVFTHAIVDQNHLGHVEEQGSIHAHCADVGALAFLNNQREKDNKDSHATWTIANRDLSVDIRMGNKKSLLAGEKASAENDYGYVHSNGHILGHAFYCAVRTHGSKADGVMFHIWFEAMKQVDKKDTLATFVNKTIHAAMKRDGFPCIAPVTAAVVFGWLHIGVQFEALQPRAAPALPALPDPNG